MLKSRYMSFPVSLSKSCPVGEVYDFHDKRCRKLICLSTVDNQQCHTLDVITGRWQGMPVAVKRFHALITTPRTIPTFQREVLTASRLHHPNIIRVCGAVMEDGIPFQIVSELLEGSVSEVIDAAHSSPCYLSHYEQLSVVVEMTSAIAYLHGLQPRPYVHADIRPKKKKIMS